MTTQKLKRKNALYQRPITDFINTNYVFKLKDIIKWCTDPVNKGNMIADCIISYIVDHYLCSIFALKDKKFKIVYIPLRSYTPKSRDEYNKYLGYCVLCVN